MTDDWPLVWYWKKKLPGRKGQPCRILARSITVKGKNMNSVLVEFQDGHTVITSGWAVRRRKEKR